MMILLSYVANPYFLIMRLIKIFISRNDNVILYSLSHVYNYRYLKNELVVYSKKLFCSLSLVVSLIVAST